MTPTIDASQNARPVHREIRRETKPGRFFFGADSSGQPVPDSFSGDGTLLSGDVGGR